MIAPFSFRFLLLIALALLALHMVPLVVIANVSDRQVNWFYLLLSAVLSLGLAYFLIWKLYGLQHQRSRLSNAINHFVHELKSPLTAVTIGLEGLRDESTRHDSALAEEYLSISLLELERLNNMVENTLRLFNYESPGSAIQIQKVNLEKVIRQALKAVSLQARHRNADIQLQLDAHGLYVHGDRMHLTNLMINLLDNALKYASEEPRIAVRLRRDHDQAIITVQDNGMGIAPEHQQQIFSKYYRVPTKKVSKIKGHGLGLHYVAWVARKHGGRIGVDSRVGEGSVFSVSLPVEKG